MPGPLFWSYARMYERLQAEETTRLINIAAVGANTLKPKARDEFLAEINQALGGRKSKRPASIEELRHEFPDIEVVTEAE